MIEHFDALQRLWKPALAVYAGMSVITALVYVVDKRKAVQGRERISERTLHSFELLGGWPGALLAQQLLEGGHALTRLTEEEINLETAFMTLTKGITS